MQVSVMGEIQPREALVILGMHRSGTSSLAGVLTKLGAAAPNTLMTSRPDNPLGHFESERIAEFNDKVLTSAGTHWHDWRTFNKGWFKSLTAMHLSVEAVSILESEFGNSPVILVKDPRICRFYHFWHGIFKENNYNPKIIIPVRAPLEVSQSLRSRDGFSLSKGLLLWLRHVLDAEFSTRRMPRSIVIWDDLLEDWRTVVDRIGKDVDTIWTGLSDFSARDVDDFLTSDLRHHRVAAGSMRINAEVHSWVVQAYDAMVELAREPGSNHAILQLDEVRAQFDVAASFFGRELASLEIDVARLEAKSTKFAGEQEALAAAHARAEALASDGESLRARVSIMEAAETSRVAELAMEREALASAQARSETLAGEAESLRARVSIMEAAETSRVAELALEREESAAAKVKVELLETSLLEMQERIAVVEEARQTTAKQAADAEQRAAITAEREARIETERVAILLQLESVKQERIHERRAVDDLNLHTRIIEQSMVAEKADAASLRQRIAHLEAQVSALRVSNGQLRAAFIQQHDMLDAYRNSTSWKVSAPIRWVKSLQRGSKPMLSGQQSPSNIPDLSVILNNDCENHDESIDATSRPVMNPTPLSLTFAEVIRPDISIVIPVYNNITYTMRCLETIASVDNKFSFEIIVMDDGSTDETESILQKIPGIRYIRNDKNLGFLRNCNKGAALARGEYIVFLNNDTEVDRRWLVELRATFDENPNIGLVGSKLLYPDGRLQEAGGIIWNDASAWNWGRLADPSHPAYNYLRDVDYVSGASIMIRRDFFLALDRFDERYEFAYYEDTDLAMMVRAAGRRVVMQPFSVVIHHEGISSGTDESSGAKRYQVINKKIFFEKWREALALFKANGETPFIACDRASEKHVLIVDACTPTPDRDSGSIDMYNLIRILRSMSYRVHFVPFSNFSHFGAYTEALQRLGVECVYAPFYLGLDAYLSERGDMFDHAILARVDVATDAFDCVKRHCPRARTYFYTVDLHHLREFREAELTQDPRKFETAKQTEKRELALIDKVDVTIVLSQNEKKLLEKQQRKDVAILPLIRDLPSPTERGFGDRSGVLFIGGYQHTPNVDAVNWLVQEIWPEVRQLIKNAGGSPITLRIYGSNMPTNFYDFRADDIEVIGYIANLDDAYSIARLSIAPLRYGAGLKGKIASSLGYGVPVVGTSIAYEGMRDREFRASNCIGDTAKDLAKLIVALHQDQRRWSKLRDAGRAFAERSFGMASITEQIKRLLN